MDRSLLDGPRLRLLEWLTTIPKERQPRTKAELAADPSLNVRLGVRYLKYLKELFRGRIDLTLMAYNAGPNKLKGAIKAGHGDQWSGYVNAVRREYGRLKLSLGEPGDWALASR